jgi:hypothetical protein
LGVIGFAANAVGAPMLALLVILAIAIAVGDNVTCRLSLATLRDTVPPRDRCVRLDASDEGSIGSLSHQYDLASYWLVIRVLIAALVFIVIGVSAFRVGKTVRRDAGRPTVKGGSPLVVGSSRSGSPSPVGPHRGVGADRT